MGVDTQALVDVGLTQKEADIYIGLLRLGSSSATALIQSVGLHRAVVYDTLERLIEKGLVGSAMQGKKKIFTPVSPKRLMQILKEKEARIQSVLPQLLELAHFTEDVNVTLLRGKEGVKALFDDIVAEEPLEWLSLGSSGETYQAVPYHLELFHKERLKVGIKARGLLLDTPAARKRGQALASLPLTQIRYLPKSIVTPSVISIYGNKVAIYSASKEKIPFIIKVESSQLAASFKEYFAWLWDMAGKKS